MSSSAPEALVAAVRTTLAAEAIPLTPQRVAAVLRAGGQPVGDATVLAVHEALRREAWGAGPLDPLLTLPGVTDVLVNGTGQVYLDRGAGLEEAPLRFGSEAEVRRLAQRLAAQAGRRLDDAQPYADLRLPDGTRFHAVLAPIARPGTLVSLRLPRPSGMTLDDLGERGLMPPELAGWLRTLILSRTAFLISGGTGSGKTTLLAALLEQVPAGERIVLVEDSWELAPRHPHVVGLEARPANVEGAGEVTLRQLVRQALRMRPDRLVVGEVRGGEVVDLLAALNTGHEGGCGTIHANSAADVPARIEALALAAGLDRAAAHAQLAAGVGAVLHLRRTPRGRLLTEISAPSLLSTGLVGVEPLISWDGMGLVKHPGAQERLTRWREAAGEG
ncbi:MAG: TadA family conjugal transfer-associated ATPase [Nocardioides sp.]